MTAPPVATAPVTQYLHQRRRANRTGEQRSDRFYYAYVLALLGLALGAVVYGRLRAQPLDPVAAAELVARGRVWLPAALLLAGVAGLRFATWHGPVVFSPADVAHLLSAPLDRAALTRRRLANGMAAGFLLGVGLGLMAFVQLQAKAGAAAAPLLAASVLGPGALGLAVAAAGWHVECDPSRARRVLQLTPLSLPAVAALLVAGAGSASWPGNAALWSGPWGWAAAPVMAASGGMAQLWPLAATLLGLLTAWLVWSAWASAGRAPTEELARRAGLRAGLVAALYVADYRGTALLRRQSVRGLRGVRARRVRRPRWALLAIPWRDLLSTLRAPGRVAWAAVLCAGAGLAAAASPRSPAVVLAAVAAAYLGAARLLEPLRAEVDEPDASRNLPWRWGDLVLLHCWLPVLLLVVVGLVSLGAALLIGLAAWSAALPAAAMTVLVAGLLVLASAGAAQRGRVPLEVLFLGAEYLVLWLALGPLLAELTVGLPAVLLVHAIGAGTPVGKALLNVAEAMGLFLALGVVVLRARGRPRQ